MVLFMVFLFIKGRGTPLYFATRAVVSGVVSLRDLLDSSTALDHPQLAGPRCMYGVCLFFADWQQTDYVNDNGYP